MSTDPVAFDPTAPYALAGSVSLRPEPFGALVYDYATRRLSFLKTPQLVTVVRTLAEQPDEEVDVDRGERDVHGDHRPHADQAVEDREHDAGDQVQRTETQHPGLHDGEDQECRPGPAEDVQPAHRTRLAAGPAVRGDALLGGPEHRIGDGQG